MKFRGTVLDASLNRLAELLAELPQVRAIALGGSAASGRADGLSDSDVYSYVDAPVSSAARDDLVARLGGAAVADMGLNYFGDGDEWQDAGAGTRFDVMYFGLEWMREQVERPLQRFQPTLGYSTAFAYTVSRSQILYDPDGEFKALQTLTLEPYPEKLRQAVVRYNRPLLRSTISSYWTQVKKAAARDDLVSLNHRLAALLASYFDIIFAVNRLLHPGEKRLLATALATCESLPGGFETDLTATLRSAGDGTALLENVVRLLDALDVWLEGEDLLG